MTGGGESAQRLREEDDGKTAAVAVPGDWKLEGCWGGSRGVSQEDGEMTERREAASREPRGSSELR